MASSRGRRGFPTSPVESSIEKPGNASLDSEANALRDAGRVLAEPSLEIGVDWHIGGVDQVAQVRQHFPARHCVVGAGPRPGESGAGRCQGLVAESLGTPHIGHVTRDEYELHFADIFGQVIDWATGTTIHVVNPEALRPDGP